jgi:hypothetical protein
MPQLLLPSRSMVTQDFGVSNFLLSTQKFSVVVILLYYLKFSSSPDTCC